MQGDSGIFLLKSAVKCESDRVRAFKLPVGQIHNDSIGERLRRHVLKNPGGDAVFLRQDSGIYIGQRRQINVPVGVLVLEKTDERLRLLEKAVQRRCSQGNFASGLFGRLAAKGRLL